MRCPKCGYISFDHVDACLRCSKDISKVSSQVEGTTYNVAPPSFLKFESSGESHSEEQSGISFDAGQDEYDVADPDLDILVDGLDDEQNDDASITFGDELDGFGDPGEEDFEMADDNNADDVGIDLGQFEDAFEEEVAPAEDNIEINLPDELSDISDLTPSDEHSFPTAENEEDSDFSLNLDLDELGDEFSLSDGEEAEKPDNTGLNDLSLDDLGLTDKKDDPPEEVVDTDGMDLDADLDFDLDLGGLSLHGDEQKEI